jgi:hypothetical protein
MTTTAATSWARTAISRRIAFRFNGSQRILDNPKVGANVAYSDGDGASVVSRNSTEGLLRAWRTPPNSITSRTWWTGSIARSGSPPGPGSEQLGRSYDNPFFSANENLATSNVGAWQRERRVGATTGSSSTRPWLTTRTTSGRRAGHGRRPRPPSSAEGVGAVNAGYIRPRRWTTT